MRTVRGVVLAMALVGLAVPLPSGAATQPLGFAKGTGKMPCGKGSVSYWLHLSFVGRMPAGNTTYNVRNGKADGSADCGSPLTLSMTGNTLSGSSFAWSCTGTLGLGPGTDVGQLLPPEVNDLGYDIDYSTYNQVARTWAGTVTYEGTCTTVGRPGSFPLTVTLVLDRDRLAPWQDDFKNFSSKAGFYFS